MVLFDVWSSLWRSLGSCGNNSVKLLGICLALKSQANELGSLHNYHVFTIVL